MMIRAYGFYLYAAMLGEPVVYGRGSKSHKVDMRIAAGSEVESVLK
jgi:hypothetical protein